MELKKKAIQKFDQANDFISDSPIRKGIIDGLLSIIPVPFWGQAISSALGTRSSKLFEENTKKFAEEVRQNLLDVDESKLDKEFLESPEFTSVLITTLNKNSYVYRQEKIKLFAKVFSSFLIKPNSKTSYKEGFIQLIDELDVDHIRILGFIFERVNNPIETDERLKDRVLVEDISSSLEISLGRTLAYCQQLLKFGLIRDWGIGKFGAYKPDKFSITDYGLELAQLLDSQNKETK